MFKDNDNHVFCTTADMEGFDDFGYCPIHYAIGATSTESFERIVSSLKNRLVYAYIKFFMSEGF